jgi:hypothetical protein
MRSLMAQWHYACPGLLGPEEPTRTNDRELRRSDCSYPLGFEQNSAFKQAFFSG